MITPRIGLRRRVGTSPPRAPALQSMENGKRATSTQRGNGPISMLLQIQSMEGFANHNPLLVHRSQFLSPMRTRQ